MSGAIQEEHLVEAQVMQQVQAIYNGALKDVLQQQKPFFDKVAATDAGAKKPFYGCTEAQAQAWRECYVREEMRQGNVIGGIAGGLAKAGFSFCYL